MRVRSMRKVGYAYILFIAVGVIAVLAFKNAAAGNSILRSVQVSASENTEKKAIKGENQIQVTKTGNELTTASEPDHTINNNSARRAEAADKDEGKVNNTVSKNIENNERVKQPTSLGETFGGDVFLGDSITKGLSTFKYLNDANVCAVIGIPTKKVISQVDKAVKLNPKRVFILCGVNDLGGSYNKVQFKKDYTNLIKTVKTKLPDSKIYVQSILPVLPKLESQKLYIKNTYINAYNEVIRSIAKEEAVTYLNTAAVVKEKGQSVYASDGLHYKSSFYPIWLNYLKNNVK